MSEKNLWDVVHPYYCSETNYFQNNCDRYFESWESFFAEEGNVNLDHNLVFRWDWRAPRVDGDWDKPIVWGGDEHCRESELFIFWMNQRQGHFRSSIVKVSRSEEHAIREWLTKRFHHLLRLWDPLSLPME